MQRHSKVLVVDDIESTRILLQKGLSEANYEVTTAANGEDALAHIMEAPPDYVITDWRMPGINGQELCQQIRESGLRQYIYLIMMTAHSDVFDLVDGLDAGADDYIVKPVDIRELLARMNSGGRILDLDRSLTHIAGHDALTGVLNRRYLIESVDRIICVCRRQDRPVSCTLVDLDHFKLINDAHGHLIGDKVLVQAAELLQEQFRATDSIFRYGGEEFLVVLPDCSEDSAWASAERCRKAISGIEPTAITASFGVAQFSSGDSTLRIIEKADAALLEAKNAGRNRVVSFSKLSPAIRDRISTTESSLEDLTRLQPPQPVWTSSN